MSVLRIPIHVIKMLSAPTVKVLIAVLVNRDILEMEPFVKVCQNLSKFEKNKWIVKTACCCFQRT